MTTTIRVHVNGNYRATIKHNVEGEPTPREPVVVSHGEERTVAFVHGKKNTFEITEAPVSETSTKTR